jgi:spore maturation protein CgeB
VTIACAKIVISIASDDTKLFHGNDLARSAQVISSGGFIITEYIGDSTVETVMSEYVPHYNTVDELISKVDYYLCNPDEREKMIALVKERFPKDFNLETSLLEMIS